jgi:ferritin-like metal-binding protein YciE
LFRFFEDGLKDIYRAEKALVKAFPKMIKNAAAGALKEGLTSLPGRNQGAGNKA